MAVAGQEVAQAFYGHLQVSGPGQGDDAQVVGLGPVEAGALDHQDLLLQQQIENHLGVVVDLVDLGVEAGEDVQRPLGDHTADTGDLRQGLDSSVTLLEQSAGRTDETLDGLLAA